MDLSGEQWFSAVEQSRDPFVGDVELRKNVYREEPVVTVAAPIQSHTGAFLGAMVFEYHADQITKWLQNVKIAHGGYLFVVDDTGTLLAHPTYAFKDGLFYGFAAEPVFQRALAGNSTPANTPILLHPSGWWRLSCRSRWEEGAG